MKISVKSSIRARAKLFLQSVETGERRLAAEGSNLALDVLLNGMNSTGYGGCFTWLKVGGGSSPNFINSTSAIFSQSGHQITSSVTGWFTANLPAGQSLVNSIFKFGSGSGGVEQMINSVDGTGTVITVTSSATVAATSGAVWFVNQTTLQTPLFASNTYQAGSNGRAFAGNVATMFRTFVFGVQGSSYTVNEVGYGNSGTGGNVLGRITGFASVVVPTTEFLVVELQLTITQTPATITAVSNIGVNFDTSGNYAVQSWGCTTVDMNGNTVNQFGGSNVGGLDANLGGTSLAMAFHLANDITLNSSISSTSMPIVSETYAFDFGALSNTGNPTGVFLTPVTPYTFTTAGETVHALIFGGDGGGNPYQCFALVLTNPQTLPSGTFSGNAQFRLEFNRVLTNP